MNRIQSCRWLFALAFAIAIPVLALAESTCPNDTRLRREACVLDSDLVIADTIELASHTTLDCRGYRILPSSPGAGTSPSDYVASTPAMAIAITGERGVDVPNCVIDDESMRFDFGIIAITSSRITPPNVAHGLRYECPRLKKRK
jgi:hypothetical protein